MGGTLAASRLEVELRVGQGGDFVATVAPPGGAEPERASGAAGAWVWRCAVVWDPRQAGLPQLHSQGPRLGSQVHSVSQEMGPGKGQRSR